MREYDHFGDADSKTPKEHEEYDTVGRMILQIDYDVLGYTRWTFRFDNMGGMTSRSKYRWEGNGDLVSSTARDSVFVQEERDANGNWTSRVWSNDVTKFGESRRDPYYIQRRKLTYYAR